MLIYAGISDNDYADFVNERLEEYKADRDDTAALAETLLNLKIEYGF